VKPIALKPSTKSLAYRLFAYSVLAVGGGIAGVGIAYSCYKEYQSTHGGEWVPLIAGGILLPFILVIGEIIRFRMYCGRISRVMCIDCRHEFGIRELVELGRCPLCQSKRVVGVRPDDDEGPIVSLYPDRS
jgi:DNA-directed RNA polymerase subunit RPC12/RpoP